MECHQQGETVWYIQPSCNRSRTCLLSQYFCTDPPREGRLECQLMPGPRWLPDLLQHGQVLCKLAFQGSFSCKQGCRQTVYSVKTVTSAFARCSLPGGFAVHGQSVKQTQHRASPLESSIRRHSTPPRIGSHNKVSTAPGTADLHC